MEACPACPATDQLVHAQYSTLKQPSNKSSTPFKKSEKITNIFSLIRGTSVNDNSFDLSKAFSIAHDSDDFDQFMFG